jgi:hypothetical protein
MHLEYDERYQSNATTPVPAVQAKQLAVVAAALRSACRLTLDR